MRLKIKVTGRVQGVFFRASTRDKAVELGLYGFVRNEPDGSVYMEVQGDRKNELVAWVKAGGPPLGRVDEMTMEEGEDMDFSTFEVRH
ncbi:MAG: acylphosphatase [Cyclobacteriaceae bacterium]|nr:acylphosphatase [Cyclobacteriaceae bacterium]